MLNGGIFLDLAGKKILIAEDEEMLAEVIGEEFEFRGAEVKIAHHGIDALGLLKQFKPDVILSDYRMPKMNGKEFLSQARKVTAQDTPFVFLSAFGDISMEDVYDCGADAFVSKPCNMNDLTQIIHYYMQGRFQRWQQFDEATVKSKVKQTLVRDFGAEWKKKIRFGMNGFFLGEVVPSLKSGDFFEFKLTLNEPGSQPCQIDGLAQCRFMLSHGIGAEILFVRGGQTRIDQIKKVIPMCVQRIPNSL